MSKETLVPSLKVIWDEEKTRRQLQEIPTPDRGKTRPTLDQSNIFYESQYYQGYLNRLVENLGNVKAGRHVYKEYPKYMSAFQSVCALYENRMNSLIEVFPASYGIVEDLDVDDLIIHCSQQHLSSIDDEEVYNSTPEVKL